MLNKKNTKEKGFTLIELLVVISIISLLSVIVIAALNDARDKAKNTKLNEIAIQYQNAFALLTANNTPLPSTTGLQNGYACLGYGEKEDCIPNYAYGSNSINTQLEQYYPALPKNDDYSVFTASGIIYRNTGNDTHLLWYVSDPKCIRGANQLTIKKDVYQCILDLN